jgi:DNA-binding NarL/FixJ family response regulator
VLLFNRSAPEQTSRDVSAELSVLGDTGITTVPDYTKSARVRSKFLMRLFNAKSFFSDQGRQFAETTLSCPRGVVMSENGAGDGVREAIVVVDDEPFSQECLIEALRGFFPHASISGVASLDDLYRSDGITVALVVLKAALFPTCDSIARAIRQLNRSNPEAAAVLVSAKDDIDVIQAIGAGVKGVVPVTASLKVGVAAFRLVIAGGTYYPRPGPNYLAPANGTSGNGHAAATASPHVLPPEPIALAKTPSLPKENSAQPPSRLLATNGSRVTFTMREADVLALLQKGHSNKWIADHLKLSENTIKVHIQHIMRKLNATNRTEAVILSVSQPDTN